MCGFNPRLIRITAPPHPPPQHHAQSGAFWDWRCGRGSLGSDIYRWLRRRVRISVRTQMSSESLQPNALETAQRLPCMAFPANRSSSHFAANSDPAEEHELPRRLAHALCVGTSSHLVPRTCAVIGDGFEARASMQLPLSSLTIDGGSCGRAVLRSSDRSSSSSCIGFWRWLPLLVALEGAQQALERVACPALTAILVTATLAALAAAVLAATPPPPPLPPLSLPPSPPPSLTPSPSPSPPSPSVAALAIASRPHALTLSPVRHCQPL